MTKSKYLQIKGGNYLQGVIKTSGSKNSSLPIIASILLCKEKTTLYNVPNILDVRNMVEILRYLNVGCVFENNKLEINPINLENKDLVIEEVKKLRGSYYLLGVLIGLFHSATIGDIGGCTFESRPINYHIDVFEKFGVRTSYFENGTTFRLETENDVNYYFINKSLGATINAILLALSINKETILRNYPHEIELFEFISFVNYQGGDVHFDEDKIIIKGGKKLSSKPYTIIPDRIEAESYALFGLTLGRVLVFDFIEDHHIPFIKFLKDNDIIYELLDDHFYIEKQSLSKPLHIVFGNESSISTDIEAMMMIYLILQNNKICIFEDKIYPHRIETLKIFNSGVRFINDKVIVNPTNIIMNRSAVYCKNLRETMGLILYCLSQNREYNLFGLEYLFRGYEDVINKIISLNGDVYVNEE